MACYQDIEVHRVEAVRGRVGEAADIPGRDGLAHPLDEPAAIVGRANVAQAAQAGPWQPTKPWIAHTEESGPREVSVLQHSLADLCKGDSGKINHRMSREEIKP